MREPEPTGFVKVVAWIGAIGFLAFGLWALLAPQSFFDTLATFEPYNRHFVHDIGAFQIGIGAILFLLIAGPPSDGLAAGLLGAGIGSLAHVLSHIMDSGLGGNPALDFPNFTIMTVALLVAGYQRHRQTNPG